MPLPPPPTQPDSWWDWFGNVDQAKMEHAMTKMTERIRPAIGAAVTSGPVAALDLVSFADLVR